MTLPITARMPCASTARKAASSEGSYTAPYMTAVVVPAAANARQAAGARRSAAAWSKARSSGKM